MAKTHDPVSGSLVEITGHMACTCGETHEAKFLWTDADKKLEYVSFFDLTEILDKEARKEAKEAAKV